MKPEGRISERSTTVVLFAVILLSSGWFLQSPGNHGVVSRIALTLSLVEGQGLSIDRFSRFTSDIAFREGRYYSDKAPGTSFLAVPAVAAGRSLLKMAGKDPVWIRSRRLTPALGAMVYLATVSTSCLAHALTATLLFLVALRLGVSRAGALYAALGYGLATMAWGWSTILFGHVLSGGCLFAAFSAIVVLDERSGGGRDLLLGGLAGILAAGAAAIEYPAAPAAAILAVWGLAVGARWERPRLCRVLGAALAGAAAVVVPVLLYNQAAFGNPLSTGYQYLTKFALTRQGLIGITRPHLESLHGILLSRYRGLFWYSPLLLAAPAALARLWSRRLDRRLAALLTAVPLHYLLLNASYAYWDGGWSTGPRHLVASLPFACLALAFLWDAVGRRGKVALITLGTISFLVSLVCVSADMTAPLWAENPLFTYLIPRFLDGDLRTVAGLAGLRGHVSLLPLVVVWGAGAVVLFRKRSAGGEPWDPRGRRRPLPPPGGGGRVLER